MAEAQEPSSDSEGLELFNISEVDPSEYCVTEECSDPPCEAPSEPVISLKADFETYRALYGQLLDSLPLASGQEQGRLEREAARARQAKDKTAGQILRHYTLDTAGVQRDSVYRWLDKSATFGSRYLLARSQFFSGALSEFAITWETLPLGIALRPEQVNEYSALGDVFGLLEPVMAEQNAFAALPDSVVTALLPFTQFCNEAGHLAANLLRRNGVKASVNCSGGQGNTALQTDPKPAFEQAKNRAAPAGLRIFPNPAKTVLTVVLPDNLATGQLELYDMQGRQVLQNTLAGQRSEVRLPLAAGLYNVVVYTADGMMISRQLLVVQ